MFGSMDYSNSVSGLTAQKEEKMDIFEYGTEYTYEQIYEKATPVTYQDEYLIADTADTKYWFLRSGHYWKLDHTWRHHFLGNR